jgi:hypothetical protein
MFQRHYQVRAGSEPPAAGPSDVRQEDFRHMKDDFQDRQQFRFSRAGMVHILANFFSDVGKVLSLSSLFIVARPLSAQEKEKGKV